MSSRRWCSGEYSAPALLVADPVKKLLGSAPVEKHVVRRGEVPLLASAMQHEVEEVLGAVVVQHLQHRQPRRLNAFAAFRHGRQWN